MAQNDSFDFEGFDVPLVDVDPHAYEEAQLAAAIAASLADVDELPSISGSTPPRASRPIDAISVGSSSNPSSPRSGSDRAQSPDPVQTLPSAEPAADIQASAFLGERAALERARLVRQKRRREETTDESLPQTPGAGPSSSPIDALGVLRATKQIKTHESKYARVGRINDAATGVLKERFWEGEIRRTPSPFSKGPTFSLPSIIGDPEDLEWAIMSAMDIDFDWVSTALPRSIPAVIISSPARNTEFKAAAVNRLTRQWVNPTPKMLPGPGVMHTKVFLFFYKSGFVRVAVNTANLLDFDWWLIENTSWVQDFPLKKGNRDSETKSPNKLADKFVEAIIRMLKGMNAEAGVKILLDENIIQLPTKSSGLGNILARYDFSGVKVALVSSIPGKYKGTEMQMVGHTGLMRALRDIGARCHPDKQVALECQGSSIGRYNADWVESFRISAEGGGYDKWFELTPKGRKELRYPPKERLKILFPTLATVDRVGRQCGGSLFFTPSFWDLPTFPKANFHDSNAKTGEILMHTKMILGTFVPRANQPSSSQSIHTPSSGIDTTVGGWIYVGSHNFTPSAFGTLARPKPLSKTKLTNAKPKKNGGQTSTAGGDDSDKDGEPYISMRNYELGIVFTLPADGLERAIDNVVCWKRPARSYGTDVPWMQQIHLLS